MTPLSRAATLAAAALVLLTGGSPARDAVSARGTASALVSDSARKPAPAGDAVPADGVAARRAGGPAAGRPEVPRRIAILCYHDLSDDPRAPAETVPAAFLRDQIQACKRAGWTFLSLSDLLARRDRLESLPQRAIVLTFDDAYRSFFDQALPILREENVPATLAVITSFVDRPPPGIPPLMTWRQIREVEKSGLVEIASHSHGLHRYETSNPYRDTGPSVAVRRYLLAEARYEDRDEYRSRIRRDLAESQRVLRARVGHAAAVLVWPYGEHNAMARALAAEAGFTTTLALGSREVLPQDLAGGCLPRVMVRRSLAFTANGLGWLDVPPAVIRAAEVEPDSLYDPDDAVFREKVDQVVARARRIGATHVFLGGMAGPDSAGRPRATYFMNHQAPIRADIWSMVAAKLSHAALKVWIRAPVLDLDWALERHPEWRAARGAGRGAAAGRRRLSPELPEVRGAAVDFFTDIAVYLPIDGVLFDDDASLAAGESLAGGAGGAGAKAVAIDALLEEVRSGVRAWRPECVFGRRVGAAVAQRRGVHPDRAQDFERVLRDGDLAVVMLDPPALGHGEQGVRAVGALARAVLARWTPPGLRPLEMPPILLELAARGPAEGAWVPGRDLAAMAWAWKRAGIGHLGLDPLPPRAGDFPPRLLEAPAPGETPATSGATR
ncbi:MAG: hypothetical protein A2W00_15385 [Candidatus Eisenbacteria bacterium RBG_16_71_46]|nr:MAG: hypothetical protein A2W00_15385 [Candidatus Eisenbacteria bacterium RBG_16_71_46]